jgi:hypothetical protein
VELDTGCSNFIKVEDASLSCSRTSSARQTANVDTLEDFVNQTEIGKVCNLLLVIESVIYCKCKYCIYLFIH